MANFTITNSTGIGGGNAQQNCSSTYKSMIIVGNSSATTASFGAGGYRRGRLYDILVGTNGTPADNEIEIDVCQVTLGTTPTGITGTLISSLSSSFGLDPADTTFVSAMSINSTGEAGITSPVEKLYFAFNQRATYRWVPVPGSEILYPAVSSATGGNGLAIRARSAGYTGTITITALIQEQ